MGNWKSVTFWRVLFIRSQSVVDVVSMRNDWKLSNSQCFLLYLNVDMIKATKGSSSGAPTPPHMHPLILKGLELHAQAFFIDASSKATLKHTSILSPDPHFCEGACGGGVGALHKEPIVTTHQDPKIGAPTPPIYIRKLRTCMGRHIWRAGPYRGMLAS